MAASKSGGASFVDIPIYLLGRSFAWSLTHGFEAGWLTRWLARYAKNAL
ncbi:MAG TPA: hypothetical protein VLK65_06045 [Vicinamibacteria bacterium]|nr:hypothetical protein [Vicinamibacteria bacterium]